MAKKESIKITKEGLSFLCIMCYNGYSDSLYGKEVYFAGEYDGDIRQLFQALGNMGAYARRKDIDKDIHYVIVANKILEDSDETHFKTFTKEFEPLLNSNNSPYRKVFFLTEDQLIWKIETRASLTSDEDLSMMIKKYKDTRRVVQNEFKKAQREKLKEEKKAEQGQLF